MLFVAPVFFLFIVNAQVDELQKALFVFFTEIHHLGHKITEGPIEFGEVRFKRCFEVIGYRVNEKISI